MTSIKASCPRHGEVSCGKEDVVVYVRRDLELRYSFPCPDCLEPVDKPAGWRQLSMLTSVGICITLERPSHHDAPPLSVDDLLDAHRWLKTHDYVAAAL